MTGLDHARRPVPGAFTMQAGRCETLGSPYTAGVLTVLADDIAAGGVSAELVGAWPGDPVADALPLRLTGALHALVLAAAAPALVACYPPHATMITERLRSVLLSAIVEHKEYIRAFLKSPPQTNEVGRSAVLLGGFLTIAKETGLPLRILEIGASAGLNTLWDKYHFRLGVADWGDRRSVVQIGSDWQGALPPLEAPMRVIERRACDMAPVDLEDAAQRLRLRAYIWADQHERMQRLEAAIAVTRAIGQRVERGRGELGSSPAPGAGESERYRTLPLHHVAVPARTDPGRHYG